MDEIQNETQPVRKSRRVIAEPGSAPIESSAPASESASSDSAPRQRRSRAASADSAPAESSAPSGDAPASSDSEGGERQNNRGRDRRRVDPNE